MTPRPLVTASERAEGARPYDFRQPEGIDRSHLRSLHAVLDVWVRLAGGVLTGALHTPVHMRVADIHQSTWEEFAASVESPAYLLVLDLSPLPGRAIFVIPLGLAMAMVDIRMSGPGTGRYPVRPVTEIEDALLSPLVEGMLGELAVATAPYLEIHPRVLQKAPDVDLLQAVIPSGVCVVVDFETRLGEMAMFPSSLCLQFPTIRPVIEAIEHAEVMLSTERSTGPSPVLVARVMEVPVDLQVVFPSVALTPVELAKLRPGDVIPLHHEPGRPLRLLAGGMELASVLPTRSGRRLAAVVVEPEAFDPAAGAPEDPQQGAADDETQKEATR
jgi:flagellar motor switch protein FliM